MSLCAAPPTAAWLRRARPLLGTLVEVGVPDGQETALEAAFAAIAEVQRLMSRFASNSDLARVHAAACGEPVPVHPWTAEVMTLAQHLSNMSGGLFDVAQGSGAWSMTRTPDGRAAVTRLSADTRLDLGGLAKGWAVDRAVQAAQAQGLAAIWVNAGGDVRVQGVSLPIVLRDETMGGVRPWGELSDGALATSDFRDGARAALWGRRRVGHLSVIAPSCAVADGLTKILAQCPDLDREPARTCLQAHGAQAWFHDPARIPA